MKKRIIDSHYHICQWNTSNGSFTEAQKNYRKKCGIDTINVLALPMVKGSKGAYNAAQNILAAILKAEDEDVYAYGGLFYPSAPLNDSLAAEYNFKAQAEEFMAIGFDGIKLLEAKPTMHKKLSYAIDSIGYEDFFKFVEENDIPINSHVNDPYEFWEKDKVPPIFLEKGWFYGDGTFASKEEIYQQIFNVLDRHPRLKMILPHGFFMGNCMDKLTKVLEKYKNVCIDLAPGPAFFQASANNYDAFKLFFNKYYDRILFGTDANNLADFSLTRKLADDVFRFFATSNEYTAFEYYDSECTLKGLGLEKEKQEYIAGKNFIRITGENPKKIDKMHLKKYIEKMLPHLEDDDTKNEIIKYCKEYL